MKLFAVCLLLVAAVTVTAQKKKQSGWKMAKGMMTEIKEGWNSSIDEMLDESTDSGLSSDVEMFLTQLKQSVCFGVEDVCESDMFLGCNCIREFQNLGEQCFQIPCNVVNFLLNDFSDFLRDFRDVLSFEDAMEVLTEQIYVPMMEAACECSDKLADATFNCIENYDAGVLDMIGRGTYEMIVGMLDLESMKKVMVAVLAIHCNEVGEEACYQDFSNQMITWARMVDRSVDGASKKDCTAYARVDKELAKYFKAMDTEDMSKVVKAQYEMSKKGVCTPAKCAKYQAKNFYSCCSVEGVDLAAEHELGENIGNILDNAMSLLSTLSEDVEENLVSREDLQTYLSTFDFETLCEGKKGLKEYKKKGKQCRKQRSEYEYGY